MIRQPYFFEFFGGPVGCGNEILLRFYWVKAQKGWRAEEKVAMDGS